MKILILTQYFEPETNAPANRHGFFSEYLAGEGHSVTVICEPPNYPAGILFKGYENKFIQKENKNGIKIIRTWAWITPKKDFPSRMLNYASFMFSSFIAGMTSERPDVVIASSPPFSVMVSGFFISIFRQIPLMTEVRDIWPESAYAVGMIDKNLFFRFAERVEKAIYRRSKTIVVNAKGIGRRLVSDKGVPENKIVFIPNGADLELFSGKTDVSAIDEKYGTAGKFVALYTGLIGLAQAPEVMIEAAKALKSEKDVILLVVGEGVLKEKCQKLAEEYGLKNVIFTGGRPRGEMPAFTQRADVAIIPYKNFDLFKDVIPSKMYDYLAAGKPMIINIDGEGARIIRESQSGLVVAPEDPAELAKSIMKIHGNKKLAKEMGRSGQKYALENYDKKTIAKEFENAIRTSVDNG